MLGVDHLLVIIEFLGTFAFAISGIRQAAGKNFDWFGGFICGIAVAIGDHPVGVDVEGFKQPTQSLLQYTMNEDEIRRVQQSAYPDQTFTTLWTQKEALFKYYGTGITSSIKELLTSIPIHVSMESRLNLEKGYALTIVS